jgi:hypothetical protein
MRLFKLLIKHDIMNLSVLCTDRYITTRASVDGLFYLNLTEIHFAFQNQSIYI